jgi:hypothetical protein
MNLKTLIESFKGNSKLVAEQKSKPILVKFPNDNVYYEVTRATVTANDHIVLITEQKIVEQRELNV